MQLLALLVGIAAMSNAAQRDIEVPNIQATLQLPKPSASPPPNRIGDFISGPDTAFVVDDDTRRKLEALTKNFEKVATDNYPLIIKVLHLEGKPPSTRNVRIVVTYGYDGVAATSGSPTGPRIEVSAKYALAHPTDVGLIVHRCRWFTVVQNYKGYNSTQAPGWLVEGIADYVRWFFYEELSKHPHPRAANADARKSYQTTAAFLFWASGKYGADLVPKLNAALQAGKYTEDMFKELTGQILGRTERGVEG